MKKRLIGLLCTCMVLATVFSGCGRNKTSDESGVSVVPSLTGTYKQTNSKSDDSYMVAAIDDDTISIYWFTVSDQTTALYWTGTFVPPTDNGKYSWDSENYHDLTSYALLASGDDTKTITYDNGELSYDVSMMGVTTTVTLAKSEDVKVSTQKPSGSTSSEDSSSTGTIPVQGGETGITVGDLGASTGISSSAYDEPESPSESVEEVSKQLDITAKATLDGQIVLFITNNSQTTIDDLEVKVNYLDANNMVIDQSTDGHDMILPGHTVVSRMSVPSVEFSDAQVEYNVELGCYSDYINYSDQVSVTANPGDGCVMVQIANNSNASIDEIEYDVVLFKGDEVALVTYPEDVYDLGAGQSTTEKVDVYSEKTFENLVYGTDYDRIEVYLNQATSFGF